MILSFFYFTFIATTNSTHTVSGKVFATDFKNPTPGNITQANLDQQAALTFAMQEAPPKQVFGAVDLIGQTFTPGM